MSTTIKQTIKWWQYKPTVVSPAHDTHLKFTKTSQSTRLMTDQDKWLKKLITTQHSFGSSLSLSLYPKPNTISEVIFFSLSFKSNFSFFLHVCKVAQSENLGLICCGDCLIWRGESRALWFLIIGFEIGEVSLLVSILQIDSFWRF